ncbi:CpaF family protein [Oribacterium asaccharolyticum]|uniref:CpaF family protein n=1 Tax=Oribacterium asaccharolyticum TaxID=1501332 RepID=UPI0028EF2C5D|nr:CpaF family protein [Oribacterium asaccharolyticum]
MLALDNIKQEIKKELLTDLEERQMSDSHLYQQIDSALLNRRDIGLQEKLYLRTAVFDSFRRLDLLSELLDDKNVTEIMINGPKEIFVEKKGKMEKWNRSFQSEEQLFDLIQQIVSRINRAVNTKSPIVDARLEDGSRVHVVLPPIALKGPTVTIRKFPEPITMAKLIQLGSLTEDAALFLESLVKASYNIFISGGTNSGKTTFLNALSQYIPKRERIITIEDSAELQIQEVENLVSLETRNANAEGEGAVSISDLIKASLRMSPNRIIVGEVRGKECLDMLNAMNTGHDGSISTGHGNTSRDMLRRMETMVLQGADLPLSSIRNMIASAIEIMVHLGRSKDHKRRVLEISEVTGVENGEIQLKTLYQYNGEVLEKLSNLSREEKLLRRL